MSGITKEQVKKIAYLSRIGASETDLSLYTEQLNTIFELMQQLQACDTEGVLPLAHPLDAHQPLRPDQVTETNQRDTYLALAEEQAAGLFLVPQVIE